MGPFPHDAPAATISPENPTGTDGFGFVEYAHPEPEKLHALFRQMGFVVAARHRSRAISLYRQGGANFGASYRRWLQSMPRRSARHRHAVRP